jgi:RimJ/RimL family protein N-acetyltransferase
VTSRESSDCDSGLADDSIRADPVLLTPLSVDDADEMVVVLGSEELYRFTGGAPPALAELRALYARQVAGHSPDGRQEWRNWIIRCQPGGTAAGYVQATIDDDGSRAEIAWVVGLAWQGRGLASAAARALVGWLDARGVARIQAHIHPAHEASAAVARAAGLTPTGVLEEGERLWLRERERSQSGGRGGSQPQ